MTKDQWKTLFDQTKRATGYTPLEIRRNAGQSVMPDARDEQAFKLKAEEIIAIQQYNSKGFQVIDITPSELSRSEGFCPYNGHTLHAMFGTEGVIDWQAAPSDLTYDSETGVGNGLEVPVPYWRTIFVPLVGNFAKIEYLPARMNLDNADLGGIRTQFLANRSEPRNTTELSYFSSPSTYFSANKVSGDKVILVDLNEISERPLIAKHGDSVEGYFSGLWITFKQNSPRIRVTVGFNSKIHSLSEKNKSLELWDGHGLTNNSTHAPVPFSISNVNDPTYGILPLIAAGSVIVRCLVANPVPAQGYDAPGLSVFWINSFNAEYISTDHFDGRSTTCEMKLVVATLGTAVSNYATGYGLERKILCLQQTLFDRNGGASVTCIGSGMAQLSRPVRVTLREGTGLFLIATRVADNIMTSPMGCTFTMSGYSVGPMLSDLTTLGGGKYPFKTRLKLTENPYPLDSDAFGMPL